MSSMRNAYRGGRLLARIVFSILASLPTYAQSQDRYKKWLDEDVRWIISSQERTNFLNLSSDGQREQFIIDFWERRNPTPGSPDNPFKVEHYRRIAFANQHLAGRVPGWKTDRGRIYILYGPPDSIDTHPSSAYQLASGVRASTDPFEVWYYRSIEGIGRSITARFVDKCRCGDYRQSDGMEQGQIPRAPED